MRTFRQASDEILVAICEKFVSQSDVPAPEGEPRSGKSGKGKSTHVIAQELNQEWSAQGVDFHIHRQEVYPAVREATARGLLTLTPRTHHALQRRICDRFAQDPEHVRVVATESKQPDHVAVETAQLMLSLIQELARNGRKRVHIGFGAGWTTRVVAYQLAKLLRSSEAVPPLSIHAVSSGFAVDQPHTAPVAFFGFFEGVASSIDLVGIFGPPFVAWDEYAETKKRAGVREAFRQRDEIDLLVTSLASAEDEHGDLIQSMKESDAKRKAFLRKLKQQGWVGDVQHLPFSRHGAIEGDFGRRAVTLFGLGDLARLARQPGKHVVLVSCPCGICGRTRADALVPLLRAPALKVWTHLVTDIPTAREIMENPA